MGLPSFVKEFTLPPLEWHRAMRSWSRTMRDTQPVWYDEEHGNWRLFRYEHIVSVQSDSQTFSSEAHDEGHERATSIIGMDPPRHQHLRSLVTQAFSARTIAQLAPSIQAITTALVEPTLSAQQMDIIADLAIPLPVFVMSDMLGLPRENWQLFKAFSDALVTRSSNRGEVKQIPIDERELEKSAREVYALFVHIVEEHRRYPRPNIMSLLLQAEVDGKHLSDAELYGFFVTLLVAGNITTTQLIGNA
ncbi:MAG TPA: cytochrome P450, partial [Ktedonosporobacter sp.]|nr:cytochrome P450 [Ktedonosporobacter sp.]